MIEELKELLEIRKQLDFWSEHKKKDQELLENTQEFKDLAIAIDQLHTLQEKATELETAIKEMAIYTSMTTGFKERDFGKVKIKEFTVVNILDEKQAVIWAAQNAPSCLKLTKDFDRAAKNLELPFVKVEVEYRAQIASDLSDLETET